MKIPRSHPRYESLKTRDKIVGGVQKGITSLHGLTAHGRGEAFDYLLGEKTTKPAQDAINASAQLLLRAKHPIISVNGNAAALVAKEFVVLSRVLDSPIEVNIFHSSKKRELKIKNELLRHGAKNILLPQKDCALRFLESNRKYVNKEGIFKADVVFVPLEDGDRTEALVKNGKKVIVVDLNPLSRSAQKASICIVDNITRAVPSLVAVIKKLKSGNKPKPVNKKPIQKNQKTTQPIKFNNKKNLDDSLKLILSRIK